MEDILVRAASFLAIILLGYILRRTGFFGPEAFPVLSKIVIKITLPAAIVSGFIGKEIDPSLLSLALLGLGAGMIYMFLAFLISFRSTSRQRAFQILNLPGYNIGAFAMPFVQSFLGPIGIITTSLFDVGNAFICLGTSFSVAAMVQNGGRFSLKRLCKTLLTSVPFVCYLISVTVIMLHIPVPAFVTSFSGIIGNANAFAAMLMIGVGFKVEANREQIGQILKTLACRYAVAVVLALIFYFCLPFDMEIRKTLTLLAFAPIGAAVPGFCQELDNEPGLSSAINSICIVISLVIMVTLLVVM